MGSYQIRCVILQLPHAILDAGCEIYKLLQDPMSHYESFSSIFNRHYRTLLSTFKLIPSSDSDE